MSELRGEVSRLEAEKEQLERELDTQTNHTHKQVSRAENQPRVDTACTGRASSSRASFRTRPL